MPKNKYAIIQAISRQLSTYTYKENVKISDSDSGKPYNLLKKYLSGRVLN
jgi:hypothetical protein